MSSLIELSSLEPKNYHSLNYLINLERNDFPPYLISLSQCSERPCRQDTDNERRTAGCPTRGQVIRLMRTLQKQQRRFTGAYCNTFNSHQAANDNRLIVRCSARLETSHFHHGHLQRRSGQPEVGCFVFRTGQLHRRLYHCQERLVEALSSFYAAYDELRAHNAKVTLAERKVPVAPLQLFNTLRECVAEMTDQLDYIDAFYELSDDHFTLRQEPIYFCEPLLFTHGWAKEKLTVSILIVPPVNPI